MKIVELVEKKEPTKAPPKLTRDAFLYMSPKEPKDQFAQCATCRMYLPKKQRCAILGPTLNVPPEASCGLYVHGEPSDDQDVAANVKPVEAGFVKRQVRCENCISFMESDSSCKLYAMLNKMKADLFDLDTKVDRYGCCNAQTPAD